jgi:hypothetical protein
MQFRKFSVAATGGAGIEMHWFWYFDGLRSRPDLADCIVPTKPIVLPELARQSPDNNSEPPTRATFLEPAEHPHPP